MINTLYPPLFPKIRHILSAVTAMITILVSPILFIEPAAAHAQLISTSPSDGSTIKISPKAIIVTFNEPVTGTAGSVQLLDANAKVIRLSPVVNGPTATLPGKTLPKGRYLIRWSLTSADGHMIVGATAFSLNTPTVKTTPADVALSGTAGKLVVKINGSKPGARTITLKGFSGEATVELRNTKFGAPLQWVFSRQGDSQVASGIIPAPGTYEVTVRIRISTFEENVYTGKVIIKN